MEKQKKSVGTIALVVLLLIVTVAALILATYAWAKYTSTQSGTVTANVAKWNVTLDSSNKEVTGTFNHVVSGKIAPGTSGSFQISINPGSTEVCFGYEIGLSTVTYTYASGKSGTTNAHLKFFKDAAHTQEIVLGDADAITGTYDLDGATTHNGATPAAGIETIYWVWPYDRADADNTSDAYDAIIAAEDNEAYDRADTNVGTDVTGMSITYTTRAWQIDPANAIS